MLLVAGCGDDQTDRTGEDGHGVQGSAGAGGGGAPVAGRGAGEAGAGNGPAEAGAGAAAGCRPGIAGCPADPPAAGAGGEPVPPAAGVGAGGGAADAGAGPDPAGPGVSACTDTAEGDPMLRPFGCELAFGRDDPGGALAAYSQLDFISKWVGYEVIETRQLTGCDGCTWLSDEVSRTSLVPVYYAYFIGFLGKAYGLPDGNENPDGPNLTTEGAQLIRDHRDELIAMYAQYAAQTAEVWSDRPLVWLLEGDFIQYATSQAQTNPLSLDELAELARDITCAIKGNMPAAVVAINHTTWNSDEETNTFWDAMARAGVDYDLVWTTGVADNAGFIERGADPGIYNAATATYAYVTAKTGRGVFVDTSFGLSAMPDSWTNASPETLAARIADGVIAVHVTGLPAADIATVEALRGGLDSVCR